MQEIQGKYNSAKVFTETLDEAAAKQIRALCDQKFVAGSKIRIMPDVHAGAGCTIGTTMTISGKVVPNLVGVDIGCGMLTCVLAEKEVDMAALDAFIHQQIPSGMNIRETPHPYMAEIPLGNLKCLPAISRKRAECSLGTLGGGNHFIELDRDDDGNIYLVVHSGSRYLGKQAAEYYQEMAWQGLNRNSPADIAALIGRLKAEGRQTEIPDAVAAAKGQVITDIPQPLAYVEGEMFENYIHDMKIIQQYAMYNRQAMADDIVGALGLAVQESFTTIHNYIDTEAMILRKGAVSAKAGETLLIPINMRDGSLICTGKGNPDWNFSAPHGAGRLCSRFQAKKRFSMEQFKQAMGGIYTTSVNEETLDECPMAYKSMESIVGNIAPTADIVKVIKPIYNFKAGETGIADFKKNKP